jgi:hypothetical protein
VELVVVVVGPVPPVVLVVDVVDVEVEDVLCVGHAPGAGAFRLFSSDESFRDVSPPNSAQ